MSELEQRLRQLLESWFGTTVVDMDFCPYVVKRLGEEGAAEWSRMLQGRPWTLALVDAQQPLIEVGLADWEQMMLVVCYRNKSNAGLILRAEDALPEVEKAPDELPEVDDPDPNLKVVGGAPKPFAWWPMVALGVIFGTAWITK